jgi:hypothetical protein
VNPAVAGVAGGSVSASAGRTAAAGAGAAAVVAAMAGAGTAAGSGSRTQPVSGTATQACGCSTLGRMQAARRSIGALSLGFLLLLARSPRRHRRAVPAQARRVLRRAERHRRLP